MFDASDGFKKSDHDAYIEHRIAQHCEKHGIDALTAVKHFAVLARRQALKRFLAHVELFKMTLDVPGDIAEFGVYRGLGLFTWANLLESYCIGDRTKTVWGFDNWSGFTTLTAHDVGGNATTGGFNSEPYRQEVLDAINIFDADRFIPNKPRIKLIAGRIEDTVPKFVQENPATRFSLVHLDCDVYLPTKVVLTHFWPLMPPGGVVIFDEYGIPDWPGETAAADEFFAGKGIRLRTFPWTNTPGAYIIK